MMIKFFSDFTKFDEICKTTDKISVEHKYKRDSLLGLQCVPFKDGLVAYQVNIQKSPRSKLTFVISV